MLRATLGRHDRDELGVRLARRVHRDREVRLLAVLAIGDIEREVERAAAAVTAGDAARDDLDRPGVDGAVAVEADGELASLADLDLEALGRLDVGALRVAGERREIGVDVLELDRRGVEVDGVLEGRDARIVTGLRALVRPLTLHGEHDVALARREVRVAIELAGVAVLALELLEHVPREVRILEARPRRTRMRVRVGRRLGELVARRERDGREVAAARDDRVGEVAAVDRDVVVIAADALRAGALALEDQVRGLGEVQDVDGVTGRGNRPLCRVGGGEAGLDERLELGVADRRGRRGGEMEMIRGAADGGQRAVLGGDGLPVRAGPDRVAERLEIGNTCVTGPGHADDDRVLEDRAAIRAELTHRRRECRVRGAHGSMIELGRGGSRHGGRVGRARGRRVRRRGRGGRRRHVLHDRRPAGDGETRGNDDTEEGVVLHGRAHLSIELSVVWPWTRLERGTTAFPDRKITRTFVANSSIESARLRRG